MGTRSALFAFAIRVGSAALLFGSQILLARWMGIHEFGILTYCVMLMSVLGVVSSGGLLWATVKFLSEYVATENWAKFRRFLASARVTSVWTGALCLVIALGVINLVGDRISDALVLPLIIVLASLPIQTFNEFHEGVGKSQGWIGLSLAPAFIFRPILILAFLGFAKLLGYETDVLVLKFFVTPDQISIYYAAVRTISLIGFVYFAIAVAFGAKFSGAHATGDKAALQGFYRQGNTHVLALSPAGDRRSCAWQTHTLAVRCRDHGRLQPDVPDRDRVAHAGCPRAHASRFVDVLLAEAVCCHSAYYACCERGAQRYADPVVRSDRDCFGHHALHVPGKQRAGLADL